jgi:hypothetical protein
MSDENETDTFTTIKNRHKNSKGRYMLFAYFTYYPEGGINDFIACSDDVEELLCIYSDMNNLYNIDVLYDIFDKELNKVLIRSCIDYRKRK